MDRIRAHIVVSGIVQGVFFRANTRSKAQMIEVTGWVRNRPDGTVEVIAEGERERIQRFIDWCHKGPSGASVSKVDVRWEEYSGEFQGFEVRY